MENWFELEECYLTNQPLIWVRQGGERKQIPDPENPPTEAYLFGYRCKRGKRGISRRRAMELLRADMSGQLDEKLAGLIERDDVIVIETQDEPLKYEAYRGEPDRLPL